MKRVPKLRNVTTCVDPLQSAVMFSVRPCKADLVTSRDGIVLHVSSSPLPPAGVFIVPLAGSYHFPAAEPASERVVYIQDDSEGLGSASEESGVAYVPRRSFSEEVDDQPGRHRKRVTFTTPQRVSYPSILSIVTINDSSSGSIAAAGHTQMDRSTLGDMPASATTSVGEHPSIAAVVDDCGTHYVLSITSDSPSVKLAPSDDDAPEWLDSMHDELHSMMSNDVYDLVEPPNNCNIVGSKWVLEYKRNARGEIERRKSRLVAQGFSQKPGVDFHDIYSPTVHQATIHTLMLYAAKYDLEIRHVDIKCAYLQGGLHETICMGQPPILNDGTDKIWRLKKPIDGFVAIDIYGLKQVPGQWNHKLQSTLKSMGFRQANNDPALFTNPTTKAIIFIWVDDLVHVSNSEQTESYVKSILEQFEGRDLGDASWILGL
jgi:hypothetical protein